MEMDQDPDDVMIIRSTIDLAHNFGLRVVAEGVASACTLDKPRKPGCEQAQGFHIARPASASAIARDLSFRRPG